MNRALLLIAAGVALISAYELSSKGSLFLFTGPILLIAGIGRLLVSDMEIR